MPYSGERAWTRTEHQNFARLLDKRLRGMGLAPLSSYTSEEDSVSLAFLDLVDVVPEDYVGQAYKVVRVESAEANLEFASLLGTANQIIIADGANDYTFSADGQFHIYDDSAQPYIRIINNSDTERDPVLQFAVGATPAVAWTMGVDDSWIDDLSICLGDTLVETYAEGLYVDIYTGEIDIFPSLEAGLGEESYCSLYATESDGSYYADLTVNHHTHVGYTTGNVYIFTYTDNPTADEPGWLDAIWLWSGNGEVSIESGANDGAALAYFNVLAGDITVGGLNESEIYSGADHWYHEGPIHLGEVIFRATDPSWQEGTWLSFGNSTTALVTTKTSRLLMHDAASYGSLLNINDSGTGYRQYEYTATTGLCTFGNYAYATQIATGYMGIHKFTYPGLYRIALLTGDAGSGDDAFSSPYGLDTDGTHLYIADTSNHRIKKHHCSDLTYDSKIGGSGTGNDQFSSPRGICLWGSYFYVADTGNNRIVKRLCSTLAYDSKIGTAGAGNDNFSGPWAIATDGTYLYVLDDGNNRIVKRLCSTLAYDSEVDIGTNDTGALETDGTYLWFLSTRDITMYRYNCSDLSLDTSWTQPGETDSHFHGSAGIAKVLDGTEGPFWLFYPDGSLIDCWPVLRHFRPIRFVEDSVAMENYVELKSPAVITASYSLTLPSADSSGIQALVSNGSGVFSWATIPGAIAAQAHIGDPSGGDVVDTEARAALATLLSELETAGILLAV